MKLLSHLRHPASRKRVEGSALIVTVVIAFAGLGRHFGGLLLLAGVVALLVLFGFLVAVVVVRIVRLRILRLDPGQFEMLEHVGADNIFTIEFEDSDREMARKVVAATLDTFVEGTIGAQGDDSQITERET